MEVEENRPKKDLLPYVYQHLEYWPKHFLGNFSCFFLSSADFFKKNFQEHYHSVKGFGSRSGLTFVGPYLGPICLQKLSAVDTGR